jgi:Putative bacterial sensory transduction regulator
MAYEDLVRSHLERCLQDVWEVRALEKDDDGDYPFRTKSALGWVRVEPYRPALVRVFAHAAYRVKRSAALLAEINTLNSRSRLATVSWSDGVVSVSWALPAESLDRASMRLALDSVRQVADDISELTAAVFGGQVPARPHEDAEGAG